MKNYELAQEKDAERLYEMQLVAFESEAEMIGSRDVPALMETREHFLDDFKNWTVLIRRNDAGEIIGAIRFRKSGDDYEIGRLMTAPGYRNQGVATGLLHAAEEVSQGKSFELYTCSKSYINIRLYEEVGYRIYKEVPGTDGLTFVHMNKTIR